LPTIAINEAWNKRSGPGGSTRRLHHLDPSVLGGEPGSTRVIKTFFLLGMVPPLSGFYNSCKWQLCGGTPRCL